MHMHTQPEVVVEHTIQPIQLDPEALQTMAETVEDTQIKEGCLLMPTAEADHRVIIHDPDRLL